MMKPIFLQQPPAFTGFKNQAAAKAAKGQGLLIVVAVAMVAFLTAGAISLNGGLFQQAKLETSTAGSLQLYYTTQAGIQEAVGTRLYPATNYLNSVLNTPPTGVAQFNSDPSWRPRFLNSGFITTKGATNAAPPVILGRYRYMVLGGQPSRNPSGGGWYNTMGGSNKNNITYYTHPSIKVRQPAYILSKGSVCLTKDGSVLPNDIRPKNVDFKNEGFTCTTGTLREQVGVAMVWIQDPTKGSKVALSKMLPVGRDNVTFPQGYRVANASGTPVRAVTFEDEWKSNRTQVYLEQLAIYDEEPFLSDFNQAITRSPLPFRLQSYNNFYKGKQRLSGTIKSNSTFKLCFRGSLFEPSLVKYNYDKNDPNACINNRQNCGIRIEKLGNNWQPIIANGKPSAQQSIKIIPVYPALSQVSIYVPYDKADQYQTGKYRLVVDRDVMDSKHLSPRTEGAGNGEDLIVEFEVPDPGVGP